MNNQNEEIESNYWKEIFVHLLHKNMTRLDAKKISFEDCKNIFEDFKNHHSGELEILKPQIDFSPTYCTFEIFVTPTIKLRLYIQSGATSLTLINSIKGTLLQYSDGDYVKVADAKFPHNPLFEIDELLQNSSRFQNELNELFIKSSHSKKQKNLAKEFIIANLSQKLFLDSKNDFKNSWRLIEDENSENFLLLIGTNPKKEFKISLKNFREDLQKIIF